MPAPIQIRLTEEEDKQLQDLSLSEGIPRQVKLRAMALRLNADGWTVPQIAQHLHQHETHYAVQFGASKGKDCQDCGTVLDQDDDPSGKAQTCKRSRTGLNS